MIRNTNLCLVILFALIFYYLFQFYNIYFSYLEEIPKIDFKKEEKSNLSDKFPKIEVICPTMYRKATGYKYLYQTFKSFKSSLENFGVEFRLNAFQRFNITPEEHLVDINSTSFRLTQFYQDESLRALLNDPNKELLSLQNRYVDITTDKILKWYNQALDWVEMMRSWHKMDCGGSKIFLYIEDDFEICDHATAHILSLYQWAEKHIDEWIAVRSTFGFAGLFLQCRDIPTLINVIIEKSIKHTLPIDTALALFWDPHENLKSGNPRLHYTYRYVLFDHIGTESNVGNVAQRQYKCLGLMKNKIFHFQEQFDWSCEGYMMSPCKNPSIKELAFKQFPEDDIPLNFEDRKLLLKRLGYEIVAGENVFKSSCNDICKEDDMVCANDHFLQFINNCDVLRKKFDSDCRCYNMIDDNRKVLPIYDFLSNFCKILHRAKSDCSTSSYGSKRICVCKIIEHQNMQIVSKESSEATMKFNQLMIEYYSKVALENERKQKEVENVEEKDIPKVKYLQLRKKEEKLKV